MSQSGRQAGRLAGWMASKQANLSQKWCKPLRIMLMLRFIIVASLTFVRYSSFVVTHFKMIPAGRLCV